MTGITSRQLHNWITEIQTIHNAYKERNKMTYEELEEEREAQSSSYHEQKMLERWETEEAEKDITDYFQKDWRKYLESEKGKKYLEEINKNYDNYLNGKE